MNPISFDGLDVELIRQEPLWATFLDALAAFNNEGVRKNIGQLEEIRDIKATTEVGFIELTLRNMGITLPFELIVEPERLYTSVYMIPLLYQTSGTDAAFRAISFILGRRVKVTPLYTENYSEFYTKPYGPLRIDGGTWYKTTHIELEMQKVGSDETMVMPRGVTLRDRLLSSFYSMAPFNIVVDRFYTTIETELELNHFMGIVHKEPLRRLVADEIYYAKRNFKIIGPDAVIAGENAQFYVVANSQPVAVDSWFCSEAPMVNGAVVFPPSEEDRKVRITVEVEGNFLTKEVDVFAPIINVQLVEIVGPASVRSGTNAYYEIVAHHEGGPTRIHQPIVVVSPHARMIGDYLHTRETLEDVEIGLSCAFTLGGVEFTVSKLVTLRNVNPAVVVSGLRVSGPQQVREASTYLYDATAYFSDGSTEMVTALWDSDNSAANIVNGDMATSYVMSNVDFNVRARFSYRGKTVENSLPVSLSFDLREVEVLEIVGPATLYESTRGQYTCTVKYSDGTTASVQPTWQASKFNIDADGVIDIGLIRAIEDTVIAAEFEGITTAITVRLEKAPVVVTQLIIEGPESLVEGNVGRFTCHAMYSNGLRRQIEPEWGIDSSDDWVTFVNGELLFYSPESDSVLISAEFGGMRQTKTIVCVPSTNSITGMIVSGPNVVAARGRILLTATVQFEDGSFQQVTPTWSAFTLDSNAQFVPADVSSRGFVVARDVDEDMPVIIRARYFSQEVEWPMTVTYVAPTSPDRPVSSRIIGPTLFYNNQIASFAQGIVFEAHPNKELLVSSDWSIVEDIEGVMIDENGFVSSTRSDDVTFTIRAVYLCRDVRVEDTFITTSLPANDEVIEFKITGDDYLEIGQTTTYSATVVTDQDVTKVVTADWYALSDSLNIQISNGIVRVVGPVVVQSLTLAASYGNRETTITINIGESAPLYSMGPSDATLDELLTNARKISHNQITDTFNGFGYIIYPSVFGVAEIVQSGTSGLWGAAETHTRVINGVSTFWYVHKSNSPILGEVVLDITYA